MIILVVTEEAKTLGPAATSRRARRHARGPGGM